MSNCIHILKTILVVLNYIYILCFVNLSRLTNYLNKESYLLTYLSNLFDLPTYSTYFYSICIVWKNRYTLKTYLLMPTWNMKFVRSTGNF